MKRWLGRICLLIVVASSWSCTTSLPGEGDDKFKMVIYRDTWGIPHIYAPTVQAGAYAMGWAQAQDRPQELLKNFLRGMGEISSVEGASEFQTDLIVRLWDHYGTAKRLLTTVDAPEVPALDDDEGFGLEKEVRTYIRAYVRGVNDYYAAHPEDLPEWWGDRKVDEFMVVAFGRHFLLSWSIGQGFGDLQRGGIRPGFADEARGSNQLAVGPERSAEGVPILAIDPHLSWWGPSRFWEVRLHAGKLHGSGVTLPGFPTIGLGHNEHLAWAMTTGGPDTTDVYELSLNNKNPPQYRYDKTWRDFEVRQISIQVKGEPEPRQVSVLDSHYGPVVSMQDGKAYAMKMSYADSVNTLVAWYKLVYGTDYKGAVEAMDTLEVFPQNVMVADTSGNIYYQRTGRVPKRPEGYDWSRPVDGSTSESEWDGFHPAADLVQVLNPEQGYMQNCNIPPDVMMVDSPLTPDRYAPYIYGDLSYGPRGGWSNNRGGRAVELLAGDDSVTAEEAIAYILDVQLYGAERWIDYLNQAVEQFGDGMNEEERNALKDVQAWDGQQTRESTAALKFHYWRQRLGKDLGAAAYGDLRGKVDNFQSSVGVEKPVPEYQESELSQAVESFAAAMAELNNQMGSLDAAYGDVFRVGRDDKSWPLGGGRALRNVGFGEARADHTRWGERGQTSTQVVVLSKPIKSWTALPVGQSDRPESPHYTDQAEKLFSPRQLKPTWWLPEELAGHIESRTVLEKK